MDQSKIVRRCAQVTLLLAAPLFLGGCAMQGNTGQIIQAVAGLLGGLLGSPTAPGPLQGPVTAALPQAPGAPSQPGGAGPVQPPVAPGSGSANELGERIKQAAYALPDPFPYKPGTQNGNLGCADVVTHALEVAGATDKSEHQLAVTGTENLLEGKGWQTTGQPYKDGDVIIWGKLPGGNNRHIGIIVIENGQVYAINNSSSQRRPIKSLLSSMSRTVDRVMRNPGSVTS